MKTSKVKLKNIDIKPRTLVDPDTGQVIEVVEQIREGFQDVNWYKVWLMDLVNVITMLGNKKMVVFEYLIENLQRNNNMIIATYRKIESETSVSRPTIAAVMKRLIEEDVIRKIQVGVYMLNPDIAAAGSHNKRKGLLITYRGLPVPDENKPNGETL